MPLTAEQALARVNDMYAQLSARRPEIAELDAYFRGKHKLIYASPEWAKVHQDRYRGFSDNWCGVVGSAPAERTEINGFRLGSDGEVLSDDERVLWDDWQRNEGPAKSAQGFLASTVKKRSFAMVWGTRDDEPLLTWEDPSQFITTYDPETGEALRQLKAWVQDDREYATLYEPDEVWKFERPTVAGRVVNGRTDSGLYVSGSVSWSQGGWTPRQPTSDDTWPIPNPLGVCPGVEFPNRPLLGGEPLSDIAGTRSMQDAANLMWAYLFSAADWAGMPGRVITGQEPPKIPILDENGIKVGEKPIDIEQLTKGRMLWLTGQGAKIDQWDAAKLDVFTDVIQVMIRHISAQTRTPIYLVHGELGNVNGETLTGLDAPLNSKVRDSHKFYQAPVRGVFRRFALVRNDAKTAEACRLGTVDWANPAVRSDAQVSDAALKDRQVGWSFAGVLERRYGMSPAQIDRQLDLVRREQEDPYFASMDTKDAAEAGTDGATEPAQVG